MTESLEIFFAYHQADEPFRNNLEKHLSVLKWQGLVTTWHDQKILPGQKWEQETAQHLRTAHIILLLISPDFLASEYAYTVELKTAIDRHQRGEAIVLPVILKSVDWKHDPLDKLQPLPPDGKPVTRWPDRDAGFQSVAAGIRKVVENLKATSTISLTTEKNKDIGEKLLQDVLAEGTGDQDQVTVQQQAQQISKPISPAQASQDKYHVQIGKAEVIAIGDNARAEKHKHYHLPRSIYKKNETSKKRRALLKRCEKLWLVDYLPRMLPQGTPKITQRLEEEPDMVRCHWQQFKRPPGLLSGDTSLIHLYDQVQDAFLILGEPGSGKTLLLLDLLSELLQRASHDHNAPLPVIFPLSSWAAHKLPLATWLAEELASPTTYKIDLSVAHHWIAEGTIFPLLDGLNEVETSARADCIDAINIYRQDHPSTSLVISSRDADYKYVVDTTGRKLHLTTAVRILPLTQAQIDFYLEHVSKPVETLREALTLNNSDLLELARVPFWLKILTETPDTIKDSTIDKQHIFEMYIQERFKNSDENNHYTIQQTCRWLSSLARELSRSQQKHFYLENIQFDWLPANQSRRLTLGIVILFKSLVGLSVGLAALHTLGPLWGLIFALIAGGFLAKSDLVKRKIEPAEWVQWSWPSLRLHLFDSVHSGLLTGVTLILLVVLISLLSIFLILFRLIGLPFGISLPFSISIPFGTTIPLSHVLAAGGIVALGCGAFLMFQSGWSSRRLDEDEHVSMKPNQGIRQSARNSILAGLISALIGGLIFFALDDPLDGLLCGWAIGLAFGLLNGGIDCIKHLFLRLSLQASASIPRHYVRFLDFAAERALLFKVGGGYLFIHDLLREYFAALPLSSPSPHLQKPGCQEQAQTTSLVEPL